MEYLPFGETLVEEHINSNNTPFKFNGKEFDEETGNYYYGARYYDPKLSIFISVDPLVDYTWDAYGYCYQNPVRYTDPTGMSTEDPPTDYYNVYGKHVKHVEDGSNAKKMVLINTKSESDADEAIANGYYVNQFTDTDVEQMDKIYSFAETDTSETEQGFLRGMNGETSKIVQGAKSREVGTAEWQAAMDDLHKKGDTPASGVHLHCFTYEEGVLTGIGNPKGSPGDILEKNKLGIQPSIALGFERREVIDNNSVSVSKNYNNIRVVGFYTVGVEQIIKVDYSDLKSGINRMKKHKYKP